MKKILQLSAVHDWGGGGNHIENLCHELKKLEPELENIVVVARNGDFHNRLKAQRNISYRTLPLAFNLDPRAIFRIISICREEKIDLIHLHGPTSIALAVIADQFYDLPPFVFSKKTSFPIRGRKRTLYKYNYPKIKKILCVSEATREVALRALRGQDHVEVVYHGTRMDNKNGPAAFSLRANLDIPPDKKVVGNIANHIEAKDLETFIRTAAYLIHDLGQEIHFIQIGKPGRCSSSLRKLARSLGVSDHISFLGYLPEAWNFIPQLDMMLLTSKNEGVPQVIYEAFYHGVPVVSTRAGGIPEVIIHGENGLLCEIRDHQALAKNLLFLSQNPEVIPNFARISRERLLTQVTSERMARKTLEAYKKVIDEGHN